MSKKIKNKSSGIPIKNNYNDRNIQIKFSNFNLKSIKIGDFTNFHKDVYEIHSFFCNFINKFIKHFENMTIDELLKEKHCHIIDNVKCKKCYEILKKYNPNMMIKDDITFFQFGTTNGIRIISQKVNQNRYELLFLDPHHLLYEDVKHNQKDYEKYSCCILNLSDKKRQ